MNGFIQLLKNLRYLTKFSLKDKVINAPRVLSYEDMLEDIMFKMPFDYIKRPKIYTKEETIDLLINTDASIIRFGDGEVHIMNGNSIPFQKYDKNLSEKLKEIIVSNKKNLLIGINRWYFYYVEYQGTNPLYRDFNFYGMPIIRKNLLKYINWDFQYCAAEITSRSDGINYFKEVSKIWQDKKVLIVNCKNAIEKLKHNIFENAKKIEYLYIPNKDAYQEYDNILSAIKSAADKNTLIILMAGPCAKVLAYDLFSLGYRALDLGHMAKSYDYCCREQELKDTEYEKSFFGID